MTVEEIEERIEIVLRMIKMGDNETAHCMEDELYFDVLKDIADGARDGAELAKAVLKAKEIDYIRWFA